MNQQQRKEWNDIIKEATLSLSNPTDYWMYESDKLFIAVNKYILSLEKRLNIKEPAALFKEKNEPTQ